MSVHTPPSSPEAIASGPPGTWSDHPGEMAQCLQAVFPFRKTHRQAVAHDEGMFNTVPRKNSWQLTKVRGEANPYDFQHPPDRSNWSSDAVRDAFQAHRVIPLLLCMCLGWLWGAVPVVAQDEAPSPAAEVSGPYRNLTEHHAGTFHLKREGDAVYATFRTDRSPVQHFARQQPEVLFTVPEGFRPPVAVTWEVSAETVQEDGTPHPQHVDRRVFRVRVDPEGRVRYVDDPGVDRVGYLRYHTMLAWPLAGTEPRLCERHRKIREGILAAVQILEDATLPCSLVDWSHLARIQTLSLALPVPLDTDTEWHVLLGLTNLATLQLQSWSESGWPVAEDTYLTQLLIHTPRLKTLSVKGPGLSVSADLLQFTPELEALHLDLGGWGKELVPLLDHVPRLTQLTVKDGLAPCASPNLLAAVPRLTRLTRLAVRMVADTEALACLRTTLDQLALDLKELEVELLTLRDLNVEILPSLPQLTHLTLDVKGMVTLPQQLLVKTPELTHLTLRDDTYDGRSEATFALPTGFFAHTPHLTSLSLNITRLIDLSPDLLKPIPELRRMQIDTQDSASLTALFMEQVTELRVDTGFLDLPEDFPTRLPHLKVLHLDVQNLALPENFLTHAERLEVLHLNAQTRKSLPANFLTYAPRLTDLYLRMPLLPALPPTFLVHAPLLETMELEAGHGIVGNFAKCNQNPPGPREFPEHFLSHTPRLVELTLRVPMLKALPPSFLGHAPLLQKMEVDYAYGGYCFRYGHEGLLKVVMPLRSLPVNFLTHAPNLRHLNLQAGYVNEMPSDFLSHAPKLRYLNLDANGMSALPTDFLARHPGLETVRLQANGISSLPHGFLSQSPNLVSITLDLRQVDALPEHFLANIPRLHEVEIDVHQAKTLPPTFLAHAPHLRFLNLRAHSLTALPPDLLTHAPRIQTLGLAMPLLEPTLTPEHHLWPTLQNTSYRVKVSQPDSLIFTNPDGPLECSGRPTVQQGSILEVEGREQDDEGRNLLRVRFWRNREFFAFDFRHYCTFFIDARFTTPTLDVCAAFREPEACEPIRNRYTTLPALPVDNGGDFRG